ncbi:hypothetical protein [Oerskovia flava]|uniref:hypothetical protein n=1 Tax=Oerskovia flava TaxID=2986422 RepID=UPI0022408571|nr:hypothetical protein [Oerskovia sp. JB1-3-2]
MTRTQPRRASRTLRRLALPVAAASALALAACAPITTNNPYSPSDGVRVDLTDDVRALNLMFVTTAEGEPGVMLGALSNDSGEDVAILVAPDVGESVEIVVSAGETLLIGAEGGVDVEIGSVPGAPGSMIPATVSSSAGDSTTVSIPVLDGTLPEYSEVLLP